MCLRLIDHKSMEASAIMCLSHFVDCDNKQIRYNKQLMEFLKTKANPHRMDARTRRKIYELLKKIISEKRRTSGGTIDGDLIYSLVSILEGENNPDNLILCFGMISFILKNFTELDPFIDDIFEWLSSYYPVDYTPTEKTDDTEAISIQRSDLVEALYDCFYATQLNSENLQTLLLEKLDSNMLSTKLESLECLIKCYSRFSLDSIKKYNSTLWTAIRMNCLRKVVTIEPQLLETSVRALEGLARRLAEDKELYFTFICDMYEELAIAFRKPEMDLFESAAKLLTHAILPNIIGFNYVLEKIIPTSINALEADELRPLAGLAYMFENLRLHQSHAQLKADLHTPIKKLFLKVTDKCGLTSVDGLRLIEALVMLKVELEDEDMKTVISKLQNSNQQQQQLSSELLDLEKCLALFCINYKRYELISSHELADYSLGSLIKLIRTMEVQSDDVIQENTSSYSSNSKFSLYLRLLIIELDKCKQEQIDSLDQSDLDFLLTQTRKLAIDMIRCDPREVEKIATLHAIVLNKLSDDNVNPKLMTLFASNYCQKLVPNTEDERQLTANIYLPILRWIFKALVVRNHHLATPLINLLLNFITADKIDFNLALAGVQVFSFIQSTDKSPILSEQENYYRRFSLYKQKFYMQSSKEIKVRFEKQQQQQEQQQKDELGRNLLLCTLALQIPHIPVAVYKRDYEWLVRQYLKAMTTCGRRRRRLSSQDEAGENTVNSKEHNSVVVVEDEIFQLLFGCLENLIQKDFNQQLVNFLPSLIELTLENAHNTTTSSMRIRKQALNCLSKLAATFKESDLLTFRPKVVDGLASCLSDKKRIVRQAAAEARLRWVIIGQPIGSSM